MEQDNHEKKLERLSKAIADAILGSDNVRNALFDVHKDNLIGEQNIIMLLLRMDGLPDLQDLIQKSKKKKRKSSKKEPSQYIDGKKLSRSEVKFHEYLSENFDEMDWLKKNGLALD